MHCNGKAMRVNVWCNEKVTDGGGTTVVMEGGYSEVVGVTIEFSING